MPPQDDPTPASEPLASHDALLDQLLGQAVQASDNHSAQDPEGGAQLKSFLAWLARGLSAHQQELFRVEALQATWLPSRNWKHCWDLLNVLIIGLIFGWSFYSVFGILPGLFFGSTFGIIFGLSPIRAAEEWSGKRFLANIWQNSLSGLRNGLVFELFNASALFLFYMSLIGFALGMTLSLLLGISNALIFGDPKNLLDMMALGSSIVTMTGILLGLYALFLMLPFLGLNQLRLPQEWNWSWQGFRSNLVDHMRNSLSFSLIGTGILGLLQELSISQTNATYSYSLTPIVPPAPFETAGEILLYGLAFGVILGLLNSMKDGFEAHPQVQPDLPRLTIRRLFWNSLIGSGCVAVVWGLEGGLIGAIFGAIFSTIDGDYLGAILFGFQKWLPISLLLGLLYGFFSSGGSAIVRQATLRIGLALSTPASLDMKTQLEEASKAGLLIQTEGGYRFGDELLQAHFAAYRPPDFPLSVQQAAPEA